MKKTILKISRLALFAVAVVGGTLFTSCKKSSDFVPSSDPVPTYLLGGQGTVNDHSTQAFTYQIPGLEGQDELDFFTGNSFFNKNWVTAPASTTARDGLGPMFNARACAGCHFLDGRGRPPVFDGETSHGLLVRLSIPGSSWDGGPVAEPDYGGQFNDRAITGVPREGDLRITYNEIPGTYPDGTPYSLRKPTYHLINLNYGPMDPDVMLSPRVAPQMIGLGFLEAIEESILLDWADPMDADGDGISGRPNYVYEYETSTVKIGRFGWKANQPNLRQQDAGAFLGDIGITSEIFPDENCTAVQADCQTAPSGGSPEIESDKLRKVVLYSQTIAVPMQREIDNPEVLLGYGVFKRIGCDNCHKETVKTGTHPELAALSNQTIHPFTDLLLHDMGEGLADNRPDFLATGNEWRTPPLWGIGLFETVNGHTNYLHDGRARSIEEAILWHGGEGETSKERFIELSKSDREALLKFLSTL